MCFPFYLWLKSSTNLFKIGSQNNDEEYTEKSSTFGSLRRENVPTVNKAWYNQKSFIVMKTLF